MTDKKRNLLIGGVVTVLLGLFALSFLIKEDVPAPKPVPVVEEVHMPPPPPAATPEQIAASEAADAAAKAVLQAEADTVAAAERKAAELKAAKLAEAKKKPKAAVAQPEAAPAKTRVTYTKGNRTVTELEPVAPVAVVEDQAKPKEARFNMTQGGKKMTPEDFDAWMKAQGIRIVPAKPVPAAVPAAEEKTDG